MTDIAEFLLACIAEDHEIAYGAAPSPWREGSWSTAPDDPREVLDRHGDTTARCYYGGTFGHVLRFDPTRILAECEAKRRIVELHAVNHLGECPTCGYFDDIYTEPYQLRSPCPTLKALALPYADHPDYREEWRV